jgi:hypothetical protein
VTRQPGVAAMMALLRIRTKGPGNSGVRRSADAVIRGVQGRPALAVEGSPAGGGAPAGSLQPTGPLGSRRQASRLTPEFPPDAPLPSSRTAAFSGLPSCRLLTSTRLRVSLWMPVVPPFNVNTLARVALDARCAAFYVNTLPRASLDAPPVKQKPPSSSPPRNSPRFVVEPLPHMPDRAGPVYAIKGFYKTGGISFTFFKSYARVR